MKKSILLNFAYGHGPFIRTLDLARELGTEHKIIVPETNREKQETIVKERGLESRVIYDQKLGLILKELFFNGENYETSLEHFVANYEGCEERFRQELEKYEIELEISRNPRVLTGIKNSYCTTMGLFSDFIKNAATLGILRKSLGVEAIILAKHIESGQRRIFVSEPAIFQLGENQTGVPFITKPFKENRENLPRGIYFYHSGIENLETKLDIEGKIKVYHSTTHNPGILTNPNIEAVITRAGLGVISESILAEKPLIVLPYESGDDFEIYFNLRRLKMLDLVQVYDSSIPFEENLRLAKSKVRNIQNYKMRIMRKYGTLDGTKYVANLILEDLKKQDS